jgi:transcriptional regulator with XRE-family HTH domain
MFERIRTLCIENGITVTELCKQVTGSSGNLPTWKKGNIKADSICKIADFFQVSTDYLLGRTDEPHSNDIQTGDIHNNIQGDNNGNNSINIGNQTAGMSEDAKALFEMIEGLTLLQRSKVVVMIDEMRKGA